MSGYMLTTAAVIQCPHGGTVQTTASNTKVSVAGAPVVTAADTFQISGCPFALPTVPPTPSPCIVVIWSAPDVKGSLNGLPTLSQSSSGMCYSALGPPQGPPVIVSTQTKVKST